MRDKQGFDAWAGQYDEYVSASDHSDSYPFAGYNDVMDAIYKRVVAGAAATSGDDGATARCKVLDIGIGTGNLAKRLYDSGCLIWGQDFSQQMLDIAQAKMPDAHLYYGDFTKGFAPEIKAQKFDYIVATYSLHHTQPGGRLKFVEGLFKYLKDDGIILVGDIAFRTRAEMEDCRADAGDKWDENEKYFICDEAIKEFAGKCMFEPISSCAGLIIFSK